MTALAILTSLLAVVGWVVAARQWARANAERVRGDMWESMWLALADVPESRRDRQTAQWAALRLADAKVREASRQAGRWTP